MAKEENYYELLEISETASQEVIERVYKLLAKKYHPDLNPTNPKEAEEKFKKISTAYETLSNETKRKEYDEKLKRQRAKQNVSASYTSSNVGKTSSNSMTRNDYYDDNQELIKRQQEILRAQKQKAYNDAYIEAMERMGFRVVYKKTLKERFLSFVALLLTIMVLVFIVFIMWHIPYTHDRIVEIYESSGPIKVVFDYIFR